MRLRPAAIPARPARRRHPLAVALAGSLLPAAAGAQAAPEVPATFSLQTRVYATDNGAFAPAGQRQADLVGWARPGVALHRDRPGLALDLDANAVLLGSARGSQTGAIQPDVRASLKAVALERWLGIDARALVQQAQTELFAPRIEEGFAASQRTQGSYALSPYLAHDFGDGVTVAARHETRLTTNGTGAGSREVANGSGADVSIAPRPLGGSLRWSRADSETRDSAVSRVTIESLRAGLDLGLGDGWVVGVVAGQDHSRFLLSDHDDPLYGVTWRWEPSLRTRAELRLEHRFFGLGGTLGLTHRNPFFAVEIAASRLPQTLSNTFGVLAPQGDLRTLLDAVLTTRIPDAGARAGAVDQVVSNLGIGTGVASPTYLVAAYPQLRSAVQAKLVLLGRRQSLSFTAYTATTTQLTRDGDVLALAVPNLSDNRQHGATLQYNRRLDEQLSAGATARWSRVEGLALRTGDTSTELTYRASLLRQLSPRQKASVGLQFERFSTNVANQQGYRVLRLFVGWDIRF